MSHLDNLFSTRSVLLFDPDPKRRGGRADQLRSRGVEVMCASDDTEARLMWLENSFRLILVETQNSPNAIDFSAEVRSANPKQRLAFFVGGPGYLSSEPAIPQLVEAEELLPTDFAVRLERACDLLSHPNGFREASLRMLAARYSIHHKRGFSRKSGGHM